MFQITFILVLVVGCACPSIFANAPETPGNCTGVSSRLGKDDPDVKKYIIEGWNKLVAEGRNKNITTMDPIRFYAAQVQVIDNEKQYTIVLSYHSSTNDLVCYILAWTKKTDPLLVDCHEGIFNRTPEREDRAQYDMFYFLYGIMSPCTNC